MPWSHLSHALVAGIGQSTAHSWLLWMYIFENYGDPSLDRHRRLIGTRPGTRFFIYGMNGLEVLLQMPASTHGLTSLARITGYWNLAKHVASLPEHRWVQRLLSWHPFGTRRVGRPRPGIQTLMRTAGMRILDIGEMRHWTTPYGTHRLIRL